MLKQFTCITFVTVSLATLMLPMAAQAGEVTHRELNQENRIAQGVKAHELTRNELNTLQRREAAIAAERARLAHDDHGLQPKAKQVLNQRLDNVSHQIYNYKHN